MRRSVWERDGAVRRILKCPIELPCDNLDMEASVQRRSVDSDEVDARNHPDVRQDDRGDQDGEYLDPMSF